MAWRAMDNLSVARTPLREQLAPHFVQRRRPDIEESQDRQVFPERLSAEIPYELSGEWGRLFDDVLDHARTLVVRTEGLASIANAVLERWFSTEFRQTRPADLAGYRNMLTRNPAEGYIGTCATLRDTDLTVADLGPDRHWPRTGATEALGLLDFLNERLVTAGARYAYVRRTPAGGSITVFLSRV